MTDPTKVFVGNLAFKTESQKLIDEFSAAGNVLTANIITRGPRSLGYGFVEFATLDDAQKAVNLLNQKEVDGRVINVEVARPRAEPQQGEGGDEQFDDDEDEAPRQRRRRRPRGPRNDNIDNNNNNNTTTTRGNFQQRQPQQHQQQQQYPQQQQGGNQKRFVRRQGGAPQQQQQQQQQQPRQYRPRNFQNQGNNNFQNNNNNTHYNNAGYDEEDGQQGNFTGGPRTYFNATGGAGGNQRQGRFRNRGPRRQGPPQGQQGQNQTGQQGGQQQQAPSQQAPRKQRVAAPRKPRESTPSKNTIFVANLPFSVEDEELKTIFSEKFKVVSAHVVKKRNGRSKGFGFVEFEDEANQLSALTAFEGFVVKERPLNVKVALTSLDGDEEKDGASSSTSTGSADQPAAGGETKAQEGSAPEAKAAEEPKAKETEAAKPAEPVKAETEAKGQ